MPIAHCMVRSECLAKAVAEMDIARTWAAASGASAEHMTVNVIPVSQQYGKRYAVMATLHLPTLWSPAAVARLQTGLAQALSRHFDVPTREVHIATQLIKSGMVVEDGQIEEW